MPFGCDFLVRYQAHVVGYAVRIVGSAVYIHSLLTLNANSVCSVVYFAKCAVFGLVDLVGYTVGTGYDKTLSVLSAMLSW